MNPKDLLQKILDAIDNQDDKGKFIFEYLRNIYLETMFSLIKTLPQDQQDVVIAEIQTSANDSNKIQGILNAKFTDEQIEKKLEEVSKTTTIQFIDSINDSLSQDQKTKLQETLATLQQSNE